MAVKATIRSLPTEIKTRIAELCRLQDEMFEEAFERLEDTAREPVMGALDSDDERDFDEDNLGVETEDFKLGPFSDGRWTNADYSKSLSSLSSVSREWRDIAAKILFRKVTARQCAKPIFPFAIAPRHGHLVEELDISYWNDSCSTMNIISSLVHLPRVRKIDFPALPLVCERLAKQARASELPIEFASPAYVANALRRVSLSANVATLLAGGLREASMFCSGVNLTTLELEPSGEDLRCVHSLIKSCVSLRTLKITTDPFELNTFADAASLSYCGHPTLRRLEICDRYGAKGLYEFVQNLTIDLEELQISWGTDDREEVQPSDPRRIWFCLPRLRNLEIIGEFHMSAPLVRHISPSSFPALQECTWRLHQTDTPDWPPTFSGVATTISQMRDQNLDRAVPLNFATRLDSEYYADILRSRLKEVGIQCSTEQGGGVVIGLQFPAQVALHPVDPSEVILVPQLFRKDDDDDSTVEEIGDAISVSLDRIRDLKDQAVAVGDRVQASRIAQALQEGEWLCVERQC